MIKKIMFRAFLILSLFSNTAYAFLQFPFLGTILSTDGIPRWERLKEHKFKNNIVAIRKEGEELAATGFIIGRNSDYIITNAHVALYARGMGFLDKLYAENPNWKGKIKGIKKVDKEFDFALLEFDLISKKKEPANMKIHIKDNPCEDEKIYIIGFAPREKDFVISKGVIVETEYSKEMKPCFKYDADTDPGMSGSPVFNSGDELTGLHFGSPMPGKNNAVPFKMILDKYKDSDPEIYRILTTR